MKATRRTLLGSVLLASLATVLVPQASAISPGRDLEGRVWLDSDGDGTVDAGETGLPGVRVTIRADRNGALTPATTALGERIYTATSDVDGYYRFAGLDDAADVTYRLNLARHGSALTAGTGRFAAHLGSRLAPAGAGDVSGLDFPMGDSEAQITVRLENTRTFPLGVSELHLHHADGSEVLTLAGEPARATSQGHRSPAVFQDVPRICDERTYLVIETDSPVEFVDAFGNVSKRAPINLCDRFTATTFRSGYWSFPTRAETAVRPRVALQGQVLLRQGEDVQALRGVTVRLLGPGGLPVTTIDGEPVAPTITNPGGWYTFANLPPLPTGRYVAAVAWGASPILTGLEPVVPGRDRVAVLAPEPLQRYSMPEMTFQDKSAATPLGVVTGVAFQDFDLDGVRDVGEPPAASGTEVGLTSAFGGEPLVVDVDAQGRFSFTGLEAQCPGPRALQLVRVPGDVGYQVGAPNAVSVPTCSWSDRFRIVQNLAMRPLPVTIAGASYFDGDASGRISEADRDLSALIEITVRTPKGTIATTVDGVPAVSARPGGHRFTLPALPAGQNYQVTAHNFTFAYRTSFVGVGDAFGDFSFTTTTTPGAPRNTAGELVSPHPSLALDFGFRRINLG